MNTYKDPRGPQRKIVEIKDKWKGVILLSCGHVANLNPIYTYKVGADCRCFACAKANNYV